MKQKFASLTHLEGDPLPEMAGPDLRWLEEGRAKKGTGEANH